MNLSMKWKQTHRQGVVAKVEEKWGSLRSAEAN